MNKISRVSLLLLLTLSVGSAHAGNVYTVANETPYNVIVDLYFTSAFCANHENNWLAPQGQSSKDHYSVEKGACCIKMVKARIVKRMVDPTQAYEKGKGPVETNVVQPPIYWTWSAGAKSCGDITFTVKGEDGNWTIDKN